MKYMQVTVAGETNIMTRTAYNEYRLQLSTGDFHTHTAVPALPALAAHNGFVDLIQGEFEFISPEQDQ